MYKVITVEREYGCGGGDIARELSTRLGWKLWDHALTKEIARVANVDCSAVERCEGRIDSGFHRLAKIFWRGSNESSMPLANSQYFDADRMVEIGEQVMENAARAGKCIIVGRGAPYFLRRHSDTLHIFLYAPRAEKLLRLGALGKSQRDAEELLDSIDRDRSIFIKHYFGADWPTRSLYHVMLNTAIGNENVISTILNIMQVLEHKSNAKVTGIHETTALTQP